MSGKVKRVEILKNEAQSHVEYSNLILTFFSFCDLIADSGEVHGIDAHDVRYVVKQMDLGLDDVRALSSRNFYDSYSHNFDLIVLYGERHFDSKIPVHIYDSDSNEKFLSGNADF